MYPGIHNFSEIGKLNKVLLHRPGKELEALTPATLERLLFDDVPYLKIAQEEHDNFARVLRENGVEVVYYVDEVAKAIADPARQIQLVNDFLNISKIHAKGLRASMTSYLLNMPPKQMVAELIAGIKRSEVATKEATSLMDLVEDDYPFVSDPMPNLYFTRDPGACVGNGINIHRMHTPARKRESLLLKYMYLYNRDFATEENKQWYDLSDSYSIEGGDVLVLSKDIVAVGLSAAHHRLRRGDLCPQPAGRTPASRRSLPSISPRPARSCTSIPSLRWSITTSSPSIPRSRAR